MGKVEDYLGSGLAYPFVLVNGSAKIEQGRNVLGSDLVKLLSTPVGSRFYEEEYGCKIQDLTFEQNDTIFKTLARQFIFEAINKWEKRVKFVNAEFEMLNSSDADEGKIDITVSVRILASNEVDSFIYPFYRNLS